MGRLHEAESGQDMSENPTLNGEKRLNDPITGRFIEGNPGGGRPPGSVSLITLLKQKLEECPEGFDKRTYGHLIVDRVLADAIKNGDQAMMRLVWQYIEGMPRQGLDHTGIPGTNVYVAPSKTYVFTSDAGSISGISDTEGESRFRDTESQV